MNNTFSIDNILTIIVIIGTIVAFLLSLYQYWISQKWKRTEWIANEMKQFINNDQVKNALYMLDWSVRKIKLRPDKSGSDQFVLVTNEDIVKALDLHGKRNFNISSLDNNREAHFTELEVEIRDCFDRFLEGLELFNNYLRLKLIKEEDIAPYISYWCYHK